MDNNYINLKGRIAYPKLFEHDDYGRFSAKLALEHGSDEEKRFLKVRAKLLKEGRLTEGRITQDAWVPNPDLEKNPEFEGYGLLTVKRRRGDVFVFAHDRKDPATGKPQRIVREEDSAIYSGCYVNVRLDLAAYKHRVQRYGTIFSAELVAIQFAGDADSWGGGGGGTAYSEDDAAEGFDTPDDDDDGIPF